MWSALEMCVCFSFSLTKINITVSWVCLCTFLYLIVRPFNCITLMRVENTWVFKPYSLNFILLMKMQRAEKCIQKKNTSTRSKQQQQQKNESPSKICNFMAMPNLIHFKFNAWYLLNIYPNLLWLFSFPFVNHSNAYLNEYDLFNSRHIHLKLKWKWKWKWKL